MVEGAAQTMNVSLSASVRHDFCMAYSSGRVSGSDAVKAWRSYVHIGISKMSEKKYLAKQGQGHSLQGLASIHGKLKRDVPSKERGGLWALVELDVLLVENFSIS